MIDVCGDPAPLAPPNSRPAQPALQQQQQQQHRWHQRRLRHLEQQGQLPEELDERCSIFSGCMEILELLNEADAVAVAGPVAAGPCSTSPSQRGRTGAAPSPPSCGSETARSHLTVQLLSCLMLQAHAAPAVMGVTTPQACHALLAVLLRTVTHVAQRLPPPQPQPQPPAGEAGRLAESAAQLALALLLQLDKARAACQPVGVIDQDVKEGAAAEQGSPGQEMREVQGGLGQAAAPPGADADVGDGSSTAPAPELLQPLLLLQPCPLDTAHALLRCARSGLDIHVRALAPHHGQTTQQQQQQGQTAPAPAAPLLTGSLPPMPEAAAAASLLFPSLKHPGGAAPLTTNAAEDTDTPASISASVSAGWSHEELRWEKYAGTAGLPSVPPPGACTAALMRVLLPPLMRVLLPPLMCVLLAPLLVPAVCYCLP